METIKKANVAVNELKKYRAISNTSVDAHSLYGKVVTGYQGWFNCPKDGAGRGWSAWGRKGFTPGSCSIDLWPDMSEMDDDEKYPTSFRHDDGSTAYVFSSYNRKTVLRHFKWMQDYGIDSAFVQRFVGPLYNEVSLNHINTVLDSCREGANIYGRSYCVMYDLSGMDSCGVEKVKEDWKALVENMGITNEGADKAYQYHKGKPLVVIWGVGFNDGRKYSLEDCMELVKFFKNDVKYGGNTVMLGVPTGWREQSDKNFYIPRIEQRHIVMDGDCIKDKYLHDVIRAADIVSPWTVDRYDTIEGIECIAKNIWAEDIAWCNLNGVEFMPVVFPGFSWSNMFQGERVGQIPRMKGRFLWEQYYEAINAGARMIYQAMFDEVNEGTAIFKCTNNPPVGESSFLDYEGHPSDYYLWMAGMGGKMLRNEIALSKRIPDRE